MNLDNIEYLGYYYKIMSIYLYSLNSHMLDVQTS